MKLSTEQLARLGRLLDEVVDADAAARRRWLQALPAEHRDLEAALRQALWPSDARAPDGETARLSRLVGAAAEPAGGPQPGDLVGPWRLLRPLGAGGMAEVWLAQRADGAFRREVALKMPARLGRHEELARRFAVERDILAALEHPRIARFYDAGVDADGRPYLALEYVAGRNLLQWADAHRLAIRARVELFLQVLEAVQYAHERGVLHRDLKPANVLVTEAGQVSLLDFGVARFIERPAEADLTTPYGRALTPGYASPEHLEGQAIDAASDVYSLGVVLHELLCGRAPRESARRALAPDGTLPPPSACLDAAAAEARGASVARLARSLGGDLDAIVLKALSASPARRYASAAALAQDLRRHLAGEPVEAVPPSRRDRTARLLKRHRVRLAQAAALAVVVAGVAYALAPRRQAAAPPQPIALSPPLQASGAPSAAPDARGVPAVALPSGMRPPDAEARERVLQGEVYAEGPFARDAQRAEALFRQAIALDPGYALPWVRLGLLYMKQADLSRATRQEANAMAREAIETALRTDSHLMAAHAARFRHAVRADHAWSAARAALDRMRVLDPADPFLLPECEASFASVAGRLDEAIAIQRQIVARDPLNAAAIGTLAAYLLEDDRFEESLALLQRELQLNPHAVGSRALMGVNLALLGKGEPALAEIAREPHEPHRLRAAAIAYWTLGRADAAEAAASRLEQHPQARAYAIAQLHALRGRRTLAFEWLDKACVERLGGCEALRADRFLRDLRGDRRYRALLAKMKLDEESLGWAR